MSNTGYIKSLDGVRAIAIILVMTFHAELTQFGWIGVQLFFVLSGFLITGILWKEKSKEGNLLFKFKKFWVRRSLRIFPLYYAYILGIALSFLFFHFPSYFKVFFPYLISYTANFPLHLLHTLGNPLFNHLWSLSIEEQFYLLFPLIILLSPKNFSKKLLIAIIFLSPVIRFLAGEFYKSKGLAAIDVADGVNFNTLCQLDAFCMGGIIHVLSLDKQIKQPTALFVGALFLMFGAGVLNYFFSASSVSYWKDLGFSHYFINNYQHVWHYSLLDIVFTSFILMLVSSFSQTSFSYLRKFLENKWMVRVGRVSYGMYLFHWLIWVYVFTKIFHPQTYMTKILLFIPYLVAVYLFSELSYRLYEVHFINLKDKFFPERNKNNNASVRSLVVNPLINSQTSSKSN